MNAVKQVIQSLQFKLITSLIAVTACAVAFAQAPPKDHQPPKDMGPDIVVFDELKELYTTVPFEHRVHAEMAEMWDGCVTCHHRPPTTDAQGNKIEPGPHTQDQADQIPDCKSCHKIIKEDTILGELGVPHLKAAYHRQCLNCHRDWSGANNCNICHEPIAQRAAATQPTTKEVLDRMHTPIEDPKDIIYEARFMPVAGELAMFRHQEHVQRFGLTCVECHYRDSCASCHSPDAEKGSHKVLQTARSWEDSHDPCISCHVGQKCSHCHYKKDQSPPPTFDHQTTGQILDDDHKNIECRQCHHEPHFRNHVTCGDSNCHNQTLAISYPEHKPGPLVQKTLTSTTATADSQSPTTPPTQVTAVSEQKIPRELQRWRILSAQRIAEMSDPSYTPTTQPAVTQPATTPLAEPPTQAVDPANCTTSDCHASLKQSPYVHGPVNVNACLSCHQLTDPASHQFKTLRQGETLCTYCHEFDADQMPVRHEPVSRGECLGCHDPHGGPSRSMLLEQSTEKLCDRCHESVTASHTVSHTPVANGDCLSCHPPHASLYPKQLNAVGPDLCLTCHVDFDKNFAQAKMTHKAMDDGCTACHGVHGSNHPLALQDTIVNLCTHCHEPISETLASAAYQHTVVTDERACLNCHTPHGSDLANLLADLPARSCLVCHDKQVTTPDGRAVQAVAEISDPNLIKHGPVAEGQCNGCHSPHASDQPHLLAGAIAGDFYEAFAPAKYELCFECHNSDIAERMIGTEVTNFRNGELNLHYVHVRGRLWGRNCLVCHQPHAGKNNLLLRKSVTYGQFQIPIEFQKTNTGGGCAAGCHFAFIYDRVDPVALPEGKFGTQRPELPATQPATLKTIEIKSLDITGREIQIPAPDQPSLILFFRPQADNQVQLFSLLKAVNGTKNIQPVLVLCGPDSQSYANALQQSQATHWPVLVDDNLSLSGKLDVRAWPLVMIVDDHGTLLTRLGGAAPTIALRLPAYIKWITEAEDNHAPPSPLSSDQHIVTDGPARQQRWYEQRTRMLLDVKQYEKAKQVIDDGIGRYPDDTELSALLVEVLISLGQVDQAQATLDQLPENALAQTRKPLLQARIFIAREQWTDAESILLNIVDRNPRSALAWNLLANVYEQQKQWQKATEAYRAARDADKS